jgi:hypothetical protein
MMQCKFFTAVFIAVSVSGCGSIMRGTDEPVSFVSTPPGASVTTTKRYTCPATPCSIQVDRSDEFDATFTLPGYQPQIVPVRKSFVTAGGTAMVGNVVAGGLIGLGVDAATGAAYDHTPNPVQVTLVPEKAERQARRRRRGKANTEPGT